MKNDILIISIIFVAICFGISSFQNDLELKRLHKLIEAERESKVDAMKFALELNAMNDSYVYMLNSMNEYADELEAKINVLENQNEIIKDLRSSK